MSAILVMFPLTIAVIKANEINGPMPDLNIINTFNNGSSTTNVPTIDTTSFNQSIHTKNNLTLPAETVSTSLTGNDLKFLEQNVTLSTNATDYSRSKLYNKADPRKRKMEKKSIIINPDVTEWKCPNISSNRNLECGCDMPHTLRCSGDVHSLEVRTFFS